ncbi:hypothetical protein MAPG_08861 [Magnaporthiopsis poae ATCC 64411]|uniref:NmrA-like domain-containing protein n=1 Tax=Magnaporthiopsis poae (strain ATCC 64411 / 73-15) TaxID=644358 RepID=A0A0C4E8G0_MAGP6|nr:hypothetical protein MAPG_08861 [Magnaporthiopsis poae ATCC 64411]
MASFTPTNILIFGATGNIGVPITEAILKASPGFGKVIIFTSQGTADGKKQLLDEWKSQGAEVVVGDVTSAADVSAAYKDHNVDTVVSAVGRNVLAQQMELIRLAEASGTVKWFFPSEYGTDIEHNERSAGEKPHQVKLAVRRMIRDEIKKLHVTYLVTGPYFDFWVRAGNFDAAKKEANVIDDGEGKIGFCTMSDVGKFLVAALRHPEASFGKALKVQSFVVTPNQVLAEYEKQTGGAKWKVTKTPLDECRKREQKLWEEGDPLATMMTLRRIWAEGGTLYDKNDNELLGMGESDLDSLEAAVKKNLGQ